MHWGRPGSIRDQPFNGRTSGCWYRRKSQGRGCFPLLQMQADWAISLPVWEQRVRMTRTSNIENVEDETATVEGMEDHT